MNGCILNLAVKKPAMDVKKVQRIIQTTKASTTLAPTGSPVKSNACPNTWPVFTPWCMIIVATVIPIPIIRPIERSVPVSRIRPATPSARYILGDACCNTLSTLL